MDHLITSNQKSMCITRVEKKNFFYSNISNQKKKKKLSLACLEFFFYFFFNFLAHFSPLLSHYTVHKLYRKDQKQEGKKGVLQYPPPVPKRNCRINLRCLIKHPFSFSFYVIRKRKVSIFRFPSFLLLFCFIYSLLKIKVQSNFRLDKINIV